MPRPHKSKNICRMPKVVNFTPLDTDFALNPLTTLTLEEYETIRLIDYEGLEQSECAIHMNVARTTVQRLYEEARKKIASFIVNGTSLSICGGNYCLCQKDDDFCAICPICSKTPMH